MIVNTKQILFLLICLNSLNQIVMSSSLNKLVKHRQKRFTCPGDGKWPDDTDCGKYFTCQGSTEQGGWCGPGMSFDTEKQRCDMSAQVNCKDGDRPDWKPPENWQGKTPAPTTTTKGSVTDKADKAESGVILATTKEANGMKEGDKCSFKGFQSDKENCQSYFYCKDDEVKKESCPDRQLFDEETKGCKEFKNVYCGDRPVNDKGKDQCRSRPNGVYPNLENGCSDFFQCQNSRKVKTGECPQSLKFNMLTLRCDRASNVPAPCGSKLMPNSADFNNKNKFCLLIFVFINSVLYSFF